MRIALSDTCLKECAYNMYESTEASCSLCKEPCKGCFGTEANCTSCFQESSIPNLFINQCIDECPAGYVSILGICMKCRSPCALCNKRPEDCTTCDGSGGTKFVYQKRCYADCPAGSGPKPEDLTCFACN
jgi:hypothetical protein